MEEKEATEDVGVEHQMFSYMVQMENSPSGTKVVTLVDSLYVASLPPTSQPSIRGFWGRFAWKLGLDFASLRLI